MPTKTAPTPALTRGMLATPTFVSTAPLIPTLGAQLLAQGSEMAQRWGVLPNLVEMMTTLLAMATVQAIPTLQLPPPQASTGPGGTPPVAPPFLLIGTAPQPASPTPTPPSTCATGHPASLTKRTESTQNSALPAFLTLYTLLDNSQGVPEQAHIESLVTLPLGERPTLIIYVERPTSHIRVLWGQQLPPPLLLPCHPRRR